MLIRIKEPDDIEMVFENRRKKGFEENCQNVSKGEVILNPQVNWAFCAPYSQGKWAFCLLHEASSTFSAEVCIVLTEARRCVLNLLWWKKRWWCAFRSESANGASVDLFMGLDGSNFTSMGRVGFHHGVLPC